MPDTRLISTDIDNINLFDKKVWDTILPIQVIANDPILRSPLINILGSCPLDGGGDYAETAFTRRLTGDVRQAVPEVNVISDGVGQFKDALMALYRYKSWKQEDITADITGNNFLREIGDKSVQWWADQCQKIILKLLRAVFENALKTSHQVNASTHPMSWEAIQLATSMLGDKWRDLATIIMHSKQFNNLLTGGMVKYRDAGELGYDILVKGTIPAIFGIPILVTDTVPVTVKGNDTYYHSYIGGKGVIDFRMIGFNNVLHYDPMKGAGTDYILQTTKVMAHIPGVKFVRANATTQNFFSDTDFTNPACWQKIAEDDKDIPLVELITKADAISLPPVIAPVAQPQPEPEP